jgi:hypothetical protein
MWIKSLGESIVRIYNALSTIARRTGKKVTKGSGAAVETVGDVLGGALALLGTGIIVVGLVLVAGGGYILPGGDRADNQMIRVAEAGGEA